MPAYSAYTDLELTGLLSQRDQDAFGEIYRRYWHPLYLHAFHMLDDEDEAQDIVQELFIAFWNKPFCPHTSLKAYLYAAARNRVLNRIRKNKLNHAFIGLLAEGLEDKDVRTEEDIDLRELIALIDSEIARLPPRMREVFELSRKAFLSHKEIADRLGISEETVKKQVSKSMKILRMKIRDDRLLLVLLLAEALKEIK